MRGLFHALATAALRRILHPLWVPLLVGGILALVGPTVAAGQDVSARAYLSPGSTVGNGRPFVLNVEITGVQAVGQQPQLPDLSTFAEYLGSGTQTSMQMSGGRTTVALTIQHRYQAIAEGTFQIPAFDVVVAGETLTTEPLTLTVAAGGAPQSAPEQRQDGSAVAPGDLFVTARASKTSVRDGEPLIVEYRIWTRVDVTSYSFTRLPEPEGFWVEDVTPEGSPEVEQRTRDGQQFATALIRRVALIPTGPGERTVDPVGIEAQVRVRRGRDPFENFFGRSSLLGSSVVPATVLSNALAIEVAPLPLGRPQPFSGVVGDLTLSAELDRDSVDANEAITLTVRLSGSGNIRAVPEPDLDLPDDFEAFPPEVSQSVRAVGSGLSGQKTFEYVLIPRAPGAREIPPITMGYFDAGAGAYRTASTDAIPLRVSGTATDAPGGLARSGVAELRQDIRFIHLGAATLRPTGRVLFAGPGFWLVFLLPLAVLAGAFVVRRQQDLLQGDVAYARGKRAGRVAKKRLAEARRLSEGADSRAFHAEVARALRGLVADKLNLAEAGLQTTDLEVILAERGVDPPHVAELMDLLQHCDRQRFAPTDAIPEEKTRLLARASELMTALERAVRGARR